MIHKHLGSTFLGKKYTTGFLPQSWLHTSSYHLAYWLHIDNFDNFDIETRRFKSDEGEYSNVTKCSFLLQMEFTPIY
jgi:hypothetical protein